MLYNAERKSEFLSTIEYESSRRNIQNVFERAYKFESEYGSDLCDMTDDELRLMMSEEFSRSVSSSRDVTSIIRRYRSWCLDTGYLSTVSTQMTVTAGISLMQDQLFFGPSDLQATMDKVFENEYFDSVDLIYRAYLWLLFDGVPKEMVSEIKKEDVDKLKQTIHMNSNRIVMLNSYAYSVISRLCDLQSFEVFNYSNTRNTPTIRERAQSIYLLAGKKPDVSIKSISDMISRRSKKAGISLQPKFVEISGVFYRMAIQDRALSKRSRRASLSEDDKTLLTRHKSDYEQWEKQWKRKQSATNTNNDTTENVT